MKLTRRRGLSRSSCNSGSYDCRRRELLYNFYVYQNLDRPSAESLASSGGSDGGGHLVDELNSLVQVVNGKGDIARVLADHVAVSELLGEEVQSGGEVAHEGTGRDEEIVGVADGDREVRGENGSEGGDDQVDDDESNLKELLGGADVSVHGALEVGVA